jgi:H+/Cl- antiporter ClcA
MIWTLAMWIAVLVTAAILIAALKRLDARYGRPGGRSHLDQWHHGYLLLIAVGILCTLTAQQLARSVHHPWPLWILVAVLVLCVVCGVDDGHQHWIQRKIYEYRSHLWRLYRWWRLL